MRTIETKVYSLDEPTQKRLEESLQTKVEAELNTYEYFTTTIIQRVSLDQLEVDWKYVVTDGVTNFGYEYAVLV